MSGQFNLWRVSLEGGWPDQLTAFTDETVRGAGVSRADGRIVLCADHDGDEFHQLYLLDADRGWPEQLTNEAHVQHFVGDSSWAADGSGFYLATDADSEFRGLAFYDLSKERYEWVEAPTHDIEDAAASADGRIFAWLANEDGYDRLRVRDLESGRDLPAADL